MLLGLLQDLVDARKLAAARMVYVHALPVCGLSAGRGETLAPALL